MLEKFGLLSVNQLAATIKLTEVWKSIYREGFPLELDPYKPATQGPTRELRQKENRVFKDNCRLHKSESSFHIDAARVWNAAPNTIKNAMSLNIAKKNINIFCKSLPV